MQQFKDIHEVLSFLYREYGLESNEKLTPQALELKYAVLLVVESIEEELPWIKESLLLHE
jgi:hypothetical protein